MVFISGSRHKISFYVEFCLCFYRVDKDFSRIVGTLLQYLINTAGGLSARNLFFDPSYMH